MLRLGWLIPGCGAWDSFLPDVASRIATSKLMVERLVLTKWLLYMSLDGKSPNVLVLETSGLTNSLWKLITSVCKH